MAYAEKFTAKLQEHFIVVQWDQRETGKTLALNPSPQPLTFALFGQDTHALVDTLLKRFHQPKLYLAGHSWGTALGFYAAARFPEKLYAWIAISPMVDQLKSEGILLEKMKAKARHDGDSARLRSLSTIHIPFQKGEELYQDRRNLFLFNDQRSVLKSFSREYALAWSDRWLSVWNEASSVDLTETLPRIDCPVYFFAGSKDLQTNFTIAREYYEHVQAPKKDFFEFPNVMHNVPTAKPDQLQQIILEKILPETRVH
jgi:pimeloyl-ACP methyl ester carboxylesterase